MPGRVISTFRRDAVGMPGLRSKPYPLQRPPGIAQQHRGSNRF
jgi:hypothetical protein